MRFKNGNGWDTWVFPVGLKLPGVFVLPKIAKGVEGGGDLSVRTLVFDDSSRLLDARRRLEHDENNDSLSL